MCDVGVSQPVTVKQHIKCGIALVFCIKCEIVVQQTTCDGTTMTCKRYTCLITFNQGNMKNKYMGHVPRENSIRPLILGGVIERQLQ